MKKILLAAGAALFTSVSFVAADEAKTSPGISIKIDGEEVDLQGGAIEKLPESLFKALPAMTPEEMQNAFGLLMSNGGSLLSNADVSIEINGEKVKPADLQKQFGGVLKMLQGTSPEEMSKIVEQLLSSDQVGEIMNSLKVDSKAFMLGPDGEMKEIEIGVSGVPKLSDLPMIGKRFKQNDLKAMQELKPFYIGVAIDAVPDLLREHIAGLENGGVLVQSVFEGPAKEAGVESNDVIVSVSGEPVADREAFVEAVQNAGKNGDVLKLKIVRKGEPRELSVTPAKREMPPVVSSLFVPNMSPDADDPLGALMKEVHENRKLLEEILEEVRALKGK